MGRHSAGDADDTVVQQLQVEKSTSRSGGSGVRFHEEESAGDKAGKHRRRRRRGGANVDRQDDDNGGMVSAGLRALREAREAPA